jgi:hypothetical protein
MEVLQVYVWDAATNDMETLLSKAPIGHVYGVLAD